METTERDIGDVTEGDLLVFDGDLCLVTARSSSGGGKHGTAKVNLELRSLPDGADQRLNQPEDSTVETPVPQSPFNPLIQVGGDGDHFEPAVISVQPGTNVVWLWDDDRPHRLFVEGAFESDHEVGEGYTVEYTFEEPGTYPVRCVEHGAVGAMIVDAPEEDD